MHLLLPRLLPRRVPVPPLPPKDFMDRPHPNFPEEQELNPFIGADNDRGAKHRDRAYKFDINDAYQPTMAPYVPSSERPPSPPTTSPYRDKSKCVK